MQIRICIPSYKRPKVETLDYLPGAEIYVSNTEVEDYRRENPGANIIGVDPKHQGNVCRIRNHILDLHPDDIVCILDDDMKYIGYWESQKAIKLKDEAEVRNFIYRYSMLALDLGVKLWGVNVNIDKQVYREYSPFSMTSYIGSPFSVHIASPLRYDEALSLKEDYDLTIQHCRDYRKVLRVNKYFYNVKQAEQVGGCAVYRNLDKENEQLDLLIQKWGSKIVRRDTNSRSHNSSKRKQIDINPVIKIPIKGI
jgi:hypothetical protein